MYKKSADLIHLHERTGSHATKGTGRGIVWWNSHDPDAFSPRELRQQKSLKERQYRLAMVEFKSIIQIHREALEQNDFARAKPLRLAMRVLSRNLKAMRLEIDRVKALLKDHPRELKLRKLKNLLTK